MKSSSARQLHYLELRNRDLDGSRSNTGSHDTDKCDTSHFASQCRHTHLLVQFKAVFSTQSTLQHVQSVQLICDQRRVLKVHACAVRTNCDYQSCTSTIRTDMYKYYVRVPSSATRQWRERVLRAYPSCSARSRVMTTVTCSIQSSCPAGCRVGARSSKTIRYNLQVGIRNKQNKTIILRQNCVFVKCSMYRKCTTLIINIWK